MHLRTQLPDPSDEPYWCVTLSATESGYLVYETRRTERKLLAFFAFHEDAVDYIQRRVCKPWRISAPAMA